jgi:hypothetical protein
VEGPIDIVISNLLSKVLALKVFGISLEKKFHGKKLKAKTEVGCTYFENASKLNSSADIAENF